MEQHSRPSSTIASILDAPSTSYDPVFGLATSRPSSQPRSHNYTRHRFQDDKKPGSCYLLYRRIQFGVFFMVWLLSMSDMAYSKNEKIDSHRWKWIIYSTNWTFTLCTLYSFMAMIVCSRKPIDNTETIPYWYKIYHNIYIMAAVNSIVITTLYWTMIFVPNENNVIIIGVLVHGGHFVAMSIDFVLLKLPWRLKHILYSMLSGLVYAVFTFLYYQLGGTDRFGNPYIYPIIDWRKTTKTLMYSSFCMISQAIGCIIFIILNKLIERFANRSKIKEKNSEEFLMT